MLALLAAAAIAAAPTVAPDALKPPPGEALILSAVGRGVQIYACAGVADTPGAFAWLLSGPDAILTGRGGQEVARHSAGPTWEGPDGGKVVGEVAAKAASPDPAALDWLLLNAKSANGEGVLGHARHVQRLATTGGRAPKGGCDAAHPGAQARVPYTAEYDFYGAP